MDMPQLTNKLHELNEAYIQSGDDSIAAEYYAVREQHTSEKKKLLDSHFSMLENDPYVDLLPGESLTDKPVDYLMMRDIRNSYYLPEADLPQKHIPGKCAHQYVAGINYGSYCNKDVVEDKKYCVNCVKKIHRHI